MMSIMRMSPPGYDAEADHAATGSVLCDDCGTRIRTSTVATLPGHDCASIQHANRIMLSQVIQHRVFRDVAGTVLVWTIGKPQQTTVPADREAMSRLAVAGLVMLREVGREPYYEITDRALSDT